MDDEKVKNRTETTSEKAKSQEEKEEEIQKKELQKKLSNIKIQLGQLLTKAPQGIASVILFEEQISGQKKKGVISQEAAAFRNLWTNWKSFMKHVDEFHRSYPTQRVYKLKGNEPQLNQFKTDQPLFSTWFREYTKMVHPGGENKNEEHLLSGKSAERRHEELKKLVTSLDELITNGKKIFELRIQSIEKRKLEKSNAISEEQEKIRAAVKGGLQVKERKERFEDKHRQMMVAILSEPEEIEKEFETCFTLDVLKEETFDVILQKILKTGGKEITRTPQLVPNIDDSQNPRADLMKVWEEDLAVYQKYKEALEIRVRMKELEAGILGINKLEDSRNVVFEKTTSPGKFMEKIMILVLAEYWKGSTSVKVLPVDDTIDYRAAIDIVLEIQSKTKGKKTLLGIDFTMDPKKLNQEPISRPLELKVESAKKMLSAEILASQPEIARGEGFSMERKVVLNKTHMDFTSVMIEKLYEYLKKTTGGIKPGIVRSIYEAAIHSQKNKKDQPLSVEDFCEKALKESREAA